MNKGSESDYVPSVENAVLCSFGSNFVLFVLREADASSTG
jgi:hypothetical protein